MKRWRKWCYYAGSVFSIIGGIRNWPQMIPLFLRPKATGLHSLKLRQPPVVLIVRGAMDIWSVKETFLDAFYTRYGVPVEDGWAVVDVGAGLGDFSIDAAYGRPATRVYAFEPFPGSYQLLLRNLEQNAVTNVKPFQEAVWREAGSLALDLSAGEPLQIASSEVVVEQAQSRSVAVTAVTLSDILAREGLERIDLLKLDCEGAEYEILIGASNETLRCVPRIIMEYHDVGEGHTHSVLIEFLEAAGYAVSWRQNAVHDDIGYLYAARAV